MRVESRDRAVLHGADRLPGVDVLRGLAAMLVVLHHIDIRFRLNGYPVHPFLPEGLGAVLLSTGYYSVVCFFVISGFLITRLSLRRWSSPEQISPGAFYGLRAARILPCLVLVLAVSSMLHLLDVRSFVIRPERGTLGQALFAALGFHVNWYEGRHGYLPGNWDVMWSLSVEETFYLLFPLACLVLRKPVVMFFGLLLLIVIAPFNRVWLHGVEPWGDYSYLSCMDGIAFGCVSGWLSERLPLDRPRARIAMAAGVATVLLIIVFRKTNSAIGLVATGTDVTVLELGMALVVLAMGSGVGNTVFARGTSLLRAVGCCSYEVYLTHMFVIFGFFIAFRALFGEQAPHAAIYPASYALMLIVSVLLGHVVSHWFSEPANRALRAWLATRKRLDAEAPVRITPALTATIFCAMCLTPAASHAADETRDRIRSEVDDAIRAVMVKDNIPGMAVSITVAGKPRVFNYGVASAETRKPVTDDTLFELGSVTKTFTATLASWARVSNLLSMSDKVDKYLPSLRNSQFGNVSLLNLGTHTPGGLPLQVPDNIRSEEQLMQYFKEWRPTYAPGTFRTYTNPGIGTLGVITAKSMGQDFTVLMEQRLFPALGLQSSFINVPADRMADYAQGYTKEGTPVRMSTGVLSPEAYGIKSTAIDMIRFIEANMNLIKLDAKLQRAITETHTGYFKAGPMTQDLIWEQYPYPVELKTLLEGNSSAMIFNATPVTEIKPPQAPQENVWINKTGSTNGFGAYVALVPAQRLGIAILANKNFPIEDGVTVAYEILTSLADTGQ